MNVTLIGMPGSGKTFIGERLAAVLCFEFFDSDREIEKECDGKLPEILDRMGEEAFLEKEEQIIISKTKGKDSLVISPGGSIVYRNHAMWHLKNISRVVYLRAPLDVIESRIKEIPRGIVGAKTKTFADLYSERVPLYEKWAEFTVDASHSAIEVVRDILTHLGN